MKDEYIIINKTVIQKRIEELEQEIKFYNKVGALSINPNKIKVQTELFLLKQILSQSTPLIPEIEKSISFCWFESKKELPHLTYIQSDYISNLKLDI